MGPSIVQYRRETGSLVLIAAIFLKREGQRLGKAMHGCWTVK